MFIRGVDFSRHSVIVGTDADAPVPSNANGGNALAGKDLLVARVIAAAGGEAVLDLAGQRVVVQTHVALNMGDKLTVKIQEQNAGQVRLSIVTSEPGGATGTPVADDAVDGMLRELGLPADERTRLAARAQIARDGTIDRAAVQKIVHDLKPFETVTAKETNAAALLQKAGAPVTAATVAIVTSRAEPNAPPALGSRLAALEPGLMQLARGNSQVAAAARELLGVLKGIPLDVHTTAPRLAQALKGWIDRLTPGEARQAREPAEPDAMRVRAVPPSQLSTPKPGINNAAPAFTTASDLASQLEQFVGKLGAGHPEIKRVMGEAVAEIRYLQLSNGPAPEGVGSPQARPELLVPLMLPQLSRDPDGSWIQVRQDSDKHPETDNPGDARLMFVVDTEHLQTVQADLSVKDGVIALALGVMDPEDRAYLQAHLDELQTAIAKHGFETGRIGTHLSHSLPPPARQAEGLADIVRFDRRI